MSTEFVTIWCQFILQFLSLEDKLKLESVSKQFQRTTFLSKCGQYLEIPLKSVSDLNPCIKLFEKYTKLNKITLGSTYSIFFITGSHPISSDLIEVIIKYSNNLTHIQFKNVFIDSEVQKKFFDKFGHKLISIAVYRQNIDFTSATNIEELTIDSFDSQLTQMKFNRLKSLSISFRVLLTEEELDSLEVFIENNRKTLKHLDIDCYNNASAERLLTIISKAINLVHLSIGKSSPIDDNSFINYWKRIAINCN